MKTTHIGGGDVCESGCDLIREVPIRDLFPLWPIPGQRNQERVKVGNTVIVDGDQWAVTAVRVATAIIERQPPAKGTSSR